MRALTIHQPWASLIAIGAKRVETRGWAAYPGLVGERIAIHAGRTTVGRPFEREHPFRAVLDHARSTGALVEIDAELPLGHIVATAVLSSCTAMTPDWVESLTSIERAFGQYGPGRYGWCFWRVEPLIVPIPCRGHQGVWTVPPAEAARIPTSTPHRQEP